MYKELRIIFHCCAFRAGVRAVVVICIRVTPNRDISYISSSHFDFLFQYGFSEYVS